MYFKQTYDLTLHADVFANTSDTPDLFTHMNVARIRIANVTSCSHCHPKKLIWVVGRVTRGQRCASSTLVFIILMHVL